MKTSFMQLIMFDFKRLLCRLNLLIMGLFMVIGLYLVQSGIDKYKLAQEDMSYYSQLQQLRQELYRLNHRLAGNDRRIFLMPSVMSVFFGSPVITEFSLASISRSESPGIHTSLLHGNAFNHLKGHWLNYSGFLIYCGCFMVMLLGFEAQANKAFLRFTAGFGGKGSWMFYAPMVSRIFLFIIFYTVVSVGAYLLVLLNGLEFELSRDFDVYYSFSVVLLALWLFFLYLGMYIGSIRKKQVRIWGLPVVWIVTLLIIPTAVGKYFSDKSHRLSPAYQLGVKKLKLLIANEKKTREEVKRGEIDFQRRDKVRQDYEEGKGEVYDILELQKKFFMDFTKLIDDYFKTSTFFPTTFCLSLEREIGGGLIHLLDLYGEILEDEDNRMIGSIVNLPAGATGITYPLKPGGYRARSLLPGTYRRGLWTMAIFVVVLMNLAYFQFSAWVFGPFFGKALDTSHLEFTMKPGKKRLIRAPADFVSLLFSRLSGGGRMFDGKMDLLGKVVQGAEKQQIVYLANPDPLPGDLKVRTLVNFIEKAGNVPTEEIKNLKIRSKGIMRKYFRELSFEEKADAVLTLMSLTGCKIYILDDFFAKLEGEGIKRLEEKLNLIRKQGGSVVYFNTDLSRKVPLQFKGCTLIYGDEGRYNIKELG